MPARYEEALILENAAVAQDVYCMRVRAHEAPAPGQFYMLRKPGSDTFLGRPISLFDAGGGSVSFLYEVRGHGTAQFAQMRAGDAICMLGPLGHGFDTARVRGRVALVAGGIGIAPLLYAAKQLEGCQADLYCGFRQASYALDAFRPHVRKICVATDSGAEGHHGFVTDLLDPAAYDVVLTCGPEVMMRKVAGMCARAGTACFVSMERHMACGVGACLGCTCKTRSGAKCVCKDGPVFDAREVMADA
nr:dihydroorotate dehydrogenase electron transfer subunit [Maliibacterium massiliense]